jgi:hypothetical protein
MAAQRGPVMTESYFRALQKSAAAGRSGILPPSVFCIFSNSLILVGAAANP